MLLALAAVPCAESVLARTVRPPTPPEKIAPPNVGSSGDVSRYTLRNGLRVVIVRDRLAPVVTTVMNYLAGSDDEPYSQTGLAHAQEHMMFRGSKTLSASQFAEVTAITGGSFNADTQNEVTQYYFDMPSQYLDLALHLEASRARGILDSQKLWDQERGAITQEVTRDYSDAEYRLYIKILHQVLAGTAFANEGLGTVETFSKAINSPQLLGFYNKWYHPNNAILVIVGDVEPQDTIRRVEAAFGSLPSTPVPAHELGSLKPLEPATFRDESDKSYAMALMAWRFPGYDDADYAASVILADVMNSQRGALYDLVATGKALDVGFQAGTYTKAGLAMCQVNLPASEDPEKGATMIKAVVDKYKADGVPADLVEAAKKAEVAAAEFRENSIESLAFQWSTALAVEHHESPDQDIKAIQRVTKADVDRVLHKYLDNATAVTAYAVPKVNGQVSSGGRGHAGENNTIVPTEHKPLPAFAQRVLANLRAPHQTLHPADMRLPNGIRLIVQPESMTHTVVVDAHIRNNAGLEEEPHTEGVATLTEKLMPFGTTTYDRIGLQTELDKIAATVGAGTDFSLSVLSKDFERGLQLLADEELHPAFKQADFDIVKKQLYDTVVGQEKTPEHVAYLAKMKALYPPHDPAQVHATPESVQGLTLDMVHHWYHKAYRPDLATIVVVGDITPQRARALVMKYFGDWRAEGPKPNVYSPVAPDNKAANIFVADPTRVQDEVSLTETLRLRRQDPDYAALAVADTILSGGFYSSMLYHDLRELRGFVYSVDSSLAAGRTRSTFAIDYGAMAPNVDKAQSVAIADLRQLAARPLTVERLQKAKALLLGQVPLRENSYTGVASTLLAYANIELPLDQPLIDARRELAVTPATMQAAVKKWIRPNDFVRVVIGPPRK
jgi:zinc protease